MFAFALEVSIRILILAAIGRFLVWCLRRQSARTRHAVWSGVLIGMLLMPFSVLVLPSLPLRVIPPPKIIASSSVTIAPPAVTLGPTAGFVTLVQPQASSANIPARFYLAITALFLIRLLVAMLRRRGLLRSALPVPPREVWMPSTARVRLLESSKVLVPSVAGWKLPSILLPVAWRDWDRVRFDAVLAHEMAHVVRRDTALALLAAINKAVFCFHPASWWLEKRLASAAEEAADDIAVETVGDAPAYARALVEIASVLCGHSNRDALAGAAMASSSKVGVRVRRLLDERYHPPAAASIPLRIVLGTICTVAIAAISVVSLERRAQAQPQIIGPQLTFPDFGMTPQTAAELERQLAEYPKDLPTRIRLLIYYAGRREMNQAWLAHALWMIKNEPANPIVAAQTRRRLSVEPEVKSALMDAGRAAADMHVNSAAVLENAGSTFQAFGEYTRAEMYYQRARLLQPNDRRYVGVLINFYGNVIAEVERQGLRSNPTPDQIAFAERAKAELMGSNDVEIVGGVGRLIAAYMQQPSDNFAWRDRTFAERLLQRAVVLAPNDERWGRELEALRNPATTSRLIDAGPLKPIQMVPPVYPPLARQARIQGAVRFDLVVSEDGSVQEIRLVSGHPLLVPAAQEAVKQWKFEPQKLNGQPFKARTIASVPFELAGAP